MTHNEFLALTVAIVLLAVGEIARHVLADRTVYGSEFYSERDSLFFALSNAGVVPDTIRSERADSVARTDSLTQTGPEAVSTAEDGRINVNRASLAELTRLPGIGPRLAERIIAFREQHGPFRHVDELQRVSGIGPRKLEVLTPLVAVDL